MTRITPWRLLGILILPLLAFALLWWADRQAVEFLFGLRPEPPDWRPVLAWLLANMASGVVLGIAAGIAGANSSSANRGALLMVGIVPLVVVLYYFSVRGVGWLPGNINAVTAFLFTPAPVTVSCVAVGLVAVGALGVRRGR